MIHISLVDALFCNRHTRLDTAKWRERVHPQRIRLLYGQCTVNVLSAECERHPHHDRSPPVEVRLAPKSRRRVDIVQSHVRDFIHSSYERLALPSVLRGWEANSVLASSVERIALAESACPASSLPLDRVSLQIHTYQPSESDIIEEYSNGPASESGDQVLAASVCELPCRSWEGLWDSLFYPDNLKLKLLDYIHATFILSDANIDCKYITLRDSCREFIFTTIATQSTWFLGTESYCCTGHLARAKHLSVVH